MSQHSSSSSSSSLLLPTTNLDIFTSDNGEDAINAATRADAGDDGTFVSGIEVVIIPVTIEATSAAFTAFLIQRKRDVVTTT
jgi:hypothetical protein